MDDLIITSYDQIIWNCNNTVKIYDITEIKKIDDKISFDIKCNKLMVYFDFISEERHRVNWFFEVELKKVEKSFLGIKFNRYEKLKINKYKNIYELIQEVS